MASGVPTVERLGSMTPEELLAIEGVDQEGLEKIGMAVNGYYSQYDQAPEPEAEPTTTESGGPDAVDAVPDEPVAGPGTEIAPETAQENAADPVNPAPDDLEESKNLETVEALQDETATIKNAETEPIS